MCSPNGLRVASEKRWGSSKLPVSGGGRFGEQVGVEDSREWWAARSLRRAPAMNDMCAITVCAHS